MNELGLMARTGAPQLLRRAATIITERGLSRGTTHNLSTGAVDAWGALLLAAGVKLGKLNDDTEMTDVPHAWRAAMTVAWETLDWACDGDPIAWQDRHSVSDVVAAFGRAASRLEIALL